jgi:hypothetical protein
MVKASGAWPTQCALLSSHAPLPLCFVTITGPGRSLMDVDRFDIWTRGLSSGRSRRGALGIVLGSSLGLFGLAAPGSAKRKHKHKRKVKRVPPPPPQPICQTGDSICTNAKTCNGTGAPCTCGTTAEGTSVCTTVDPSFCKGFTQCDASTICTAPRVCVDVSGCCPSPLPAGSRACLLPCENPA